MNWPAVVYRMYDEHGGLLYVGCTISFSARMAKHSTDSGWFEEVETVKLQHFSDRDGAAEAELQAIQTEHPRYNSREDLDSRVPRVTRDRSIEDYVSIGEAARRLGVERTTLGGWERDGRLKAAFRTPGGHRRFLLADVLALAERQSA